MSQSMIEATATDCSKRATGSHEQFKAERSNHSALIFGGEKPPFEPLVSVHRSVHGEFRAASRPQRLPDPRVLERSSGDFLPLHLLCCVVRSSSSSPPSAPARRHTHSETVVRVCVVRSRRNRALLLVERCPGVTYFAACVDPRRLSRDVWED